MSAFVLFSATISIMYVLTLAGWFALALYKHSLKPYAKHVVDEIKEMR